MVQTSSSSGTPVGRRCCLQRRRTELPEFSAAFHNLQRGCALKEGMQGILYCADAEAAQALFARDGVWPVRGIPSEDFDRQPVVGDEESGDGVSNSRVPYT